MSSLVRGIALLGFAEFACSQGLAPDAALAEFELSNVSADELINGVSFTDLLACSAQRCGNPLFGLEFGLHQGTQGIGELMVMLQSSATVGDALHTLTRYFHAYSSGSAIHLEHQGATARLVFEVTDGDPVSVRQTVELAIGIGARLMQNLLGPRWRPSGLLLQHASAEVETNAYRRLLAITPRFNSTENAWLFDRALLSVPLDMKEPRYHQVLQHRIEELAHITLPELPAYVQKLLRKRMAIGSVTLEHIAVEMMMSPRSLQRYLLAEGTGFQELLDKTRKALATRLICDSSINLTQLAGLLGYAQLGALSRAFTRWNGMSPQKWKQQYQCTQQLRINAQPNSATCQ